MCESAMSTGSESPFSCPEIHTLHGVEPTVGLNAVQVQSGRKPSKQTGPEAAELGPQIPGHTW